MENTPLTFTVADDFDAARVEAVLQALGYDAQRVVPAEDFDAADENIGAVQRLGNIYQLNSLDLVTLGCVVAGKVPLHWALEKLLVKLNVEDEAGVLRKVLAARATVGE